MTGAMEMTQVVADTVVDARASEVLFRTSVPRPRTPSGAAPAPVLALPQRIAARSVTGISTVPPAPARLRTDPSGPRPRSTSRCRWRSPAPPPCSACCRPLPLALAAAAAWPLLLLAGGTHRRPGLGQGRLARAGRVLRTGGRTAVVVLAASSLALTADLITLAAVVGAFAAASAVHAIVDARPQALRVVLAGRPRDVRAALAALPPGTGTRSSRPA